MKAEHRKELVTHSLAERLGETFQGFKEGPSRGTVLLLVAVGLVVLLVLAWRWFATSAEETESARWLKWDSLTSPAQLKSFADGSDAQGSMPGRLGRLEEARRALHEGLRELGGTGTRKDALANLERAAKLYDKLADECADKPLIHQQVLMGAAKAHEGRGEVDAAKRYYQQLQQKYGDSVLGKDAAEQLQRLSKAEENGDLEALRKEFAPAAP